mmetsp:Transcript_12877/g.30304  ORF Transcript_12877/g.30304 Transcript_12877/m.30304 type:complete len:332 (-) Transcript_12877:307-1302(-)
MTTLPPPPIGASTSTGHWRRSESQSAMPCCCATAPTSATAKRPWCWAGRSARSRASCCAPRPGCASSCKPGRPRHELDRRRRCMPRRCAAATTARRCRTRRRRLQPARDGGTAAAPEHAPTRPCPLDAALALDGQQHRGIRRRVAAVHRRRDARRAAHSGRHRTAGAAAVLDGPEPLDRRLTRRVGATGPGLGKPSLCGDVAGPAARLHPVTAPGAGPGKLAADDSSATPTPIQRPPHRPGCRPAPDTGPGRLRWWRELSQQHQRRSEHTRRASEQSTNGLSLDAVRAAHHCRQPHDLQPAQFPGRHARCGQCAPTVRGQLRQQGQLCGCA